jgi:hypothetical protein
MAGAAREGNGLLPHLAGAGAPLRQVLAAHCLKGCRHVVEIGGAGLPITDFLTHDPESVTVFDPKIAPQTRDRLNGRPCRVQHRAMKIQRAAVEEFERLPALGVVMLGLSLKPLGRHAAVDESLEALVDAARIVVIEHSLSLDRALDQAPLLIRRPGLRLLLEVDLSIRDGVVDAAGHGERRFMVLTREAATQP